MLVKKISICTCLLICCFVFGIISEVSAEEPNAKECIDGKVDCNELENNDSKETDKAGSEDNGGSIVFDLIKMVFALLLVLALIYLLLKFLNKRNKIFQSVKALENVGGISVGQNKSIQIIRIGSRIYVVGVGDNVELLHEITNENEKLELLHSNQFQPKSLVSSLLQTKDNEDSTSKSFKSLFATELDKLKSGRKKMISNHKRKGDNHE